MPALRHETLNLTSFNSRIRNPNPNFSDSRRRKPPRNPQAFNHHRSRSGAMVTKFPSRNFVMGEVKILKRGESLAKVDKRGLSKKEKRKHPTMIMKIEKDPDLILGSTDRLGPDPETVQEQIRLSINEIYAGSGFAATSPPPSSVPVPGFLGKRCIGTATSDLRRLLRLDLD
ncbi:uncharacterized protein LOC8262850 [Ricinus communis]|uniref:uncharacterized protein LOC8262850 n=1 Tax=Ricinus communis TaxID=3988 RepID=UPI00201AD8D6|nr:uncharacterized protein LOC8262850 [Ricinus communis]